MLKWEETMASEVNLVDEEGEVVFILQWLYEDVYALWQRGTVAAEDSIVFEFNADGDVAQAIALDWVKEYA